MGAMYGIGLNYIGCTILNIASLYRMWVTLCRIRAPYIEYGCIIWSRGDDTSSNLWCNGRPLCWLEAS